MSGAWSSRGSRTTASNAPSYGLQRRVALGAGHGHDPLPGPDRKRHRLACAAQRARYGDRAGERASAPLSSPRLAALKCEPFKATRKPVVARQRLHAPTPGRRRDRAGSPRCGEPVRSPPHQSRRLPVAKTRVKREAERDNLDLLVHAAGPYIVLQTRTSLVRRYLTSAGRQPTRRSCPRQNRSRSSLLSALPARTWGTAPGGPRRDRGTLKAAIRSRQCSNSASRSASARRPARGSTARRSHGRGYLAVWPAHPDLHARTDRTCLHASPARPPHGPQARRWPAKLCRPRKARRRPRPGAYKVCTR